MKSLFGFKKILLSMFLSVAYSFGAQAGGGGTGGGAAHVCYDRSGRMNSAEFFDLYEARSVLGYNLVDPTGKTVNQLLFEAMKKIAKVSPRFADKVSRYLRIYAETKRKEEKKKFQIIKDANIVFVDRGCEYIQIANWKDGVHFKIGENGSHESTVFINAELVDLFSRSNLNLAALALHEAVYAFQRKEEKEQYSDRARSIVGKAFSDVPFEDLDIHLKNYRSSYVYPTGSEGKYSLRLTAVKNDPTHIFTLSRGEHRCEIEALGDSCEVEINSNQGLYYRFEHHVEDEKATVKIEVLKDGKPHMTIMPPGKWAAQKETITFGEGIVKEGEYSLFISPKEDKAEQKKEDYYTTLYYQVKDLNLNLKP